MMTPNAEQKALLKTMIEDDHPLVFDTWGHKDRTFWFNFFQEALKQGNVAGPNYVRIDGKVFYLSSRKGGGAGMGAFPDKIRLTATKPEECLVELNLG